MKEKAKIKLSILIPSFKTPSCLLRQCLDSVFAEERDDVEVIVCEQGDEDLLSLIPDFSERVKIIHQDNPNSYNARRRLWDEARGEYAWFVDADDLICNGALGKIVETATSRQPDLVLFNIQHFDSDNDCISIDKSFPNDLSKETLIDLMLSSDDFNSLCRKVFSKALKPVFYNATIFWADDKIMSLAFAECVKNIVHIDEPLYKYRTNLGSGTHNIKKSMVKDYGVCFSIIENNYSKYPGRIRNYMRWINGMTSNCLDSISRGCMRRKDFKELFVSYEARNFIRFCIREKRSVFLGCPLPKRVVYLAFLKRRFSFLFLASIVYRLVKKKNT